MIGSSADRDAARVSSGCSSTCAASRGFGFAAVSTLRTTGTANLQSVADEPKGKRLAAGICGAPHHGASTSRGKVPCHWQGFAEKLAARSKHFGRGGRNQGRMAAVVALKKVHGERKTGGHRVNRE